MQRKLLCRRCWFALLVVCSESWLASASAQTTTNIAGSIGGTSDFVFRGLSYTRGGPAVQASLGLEHSSGVYAGAFASSTNPNPGKSPPAEVDAWFGYQRDLNEWLSADVRYLHYAYPDDPRLAEYDRDEITATLGIRSTFFVTAMYSPNTEAVATRKPAYAGGDNAAAVELSAHRQLTNRWSISAGIGRYFLNDVYDEDYDYWGVTLSADLTPFELHLAVLGADDTAERLFTSSAAGERVTATVLYRFAFTH